MITLSTCGRDPTRQSATGPAPSPPPASAAPPNVADALRGLDQRRPIDVTLHTDHGDIPCQLDARRAPQAVALFVGLASGRATWRHPKTGRVSQDPLYLDLPFYRAIPGVMIQSGCAVGDGSGHPGYRIGVEADPGDRERLQRPGALALARYTPPPNRQDPDPPPPGHVLGSQFAITLIDMSHLAGEVTVLGHCERLEIAREIARDVRRKSSPPRLLRVSVAGL